MKSKEVEGHSFECLEQHLDSGVLERVGSLLFAESNFSVLCPNSLGIICMETKVSVSYMLGHLLYHHLLTVMLTLIASNACMLLRFSIFGNGRSYCFFNYNGFNTHCSKYERAYAIPYGIPTCSLLNVWG